MLPLLRRLVAVHIWKLVPAGLAMASVSAHAELVEIVWLAQAKFERSAEIAPSKFLEVCGKFSQGEAVTWRFDGTAASDFNIHYHQGKEVVYPARETGATSSSGKVEIAVDQDYCWMWSNKGGKPMQLRLSLEKR